MTGTFAVPAPPCADGTWDIYADFIGGLQFWGFALVSGSGDSAVRMWDSEFAFIPGDPRKIRSNFFLSEDRPGSSHIDWTHGPRDMLAI
jgi:hypothetical protein